MRVLIRLPSMSFYYVEGERVFYHRDVDYFILSYRLRCEYFLLRCLRWKSCLAVLVQMLREFDRNYWIRGGVAGKVSEG